MKMTNKKAQPRYQRDANLKTLEHALGKRAVGSSIPKTPVCLSARLDPAKMKPNATTDTLEISVPAGEPPEHAMEETHAEKDIQLNSLALHQAILIKDKPEEPAPKLHKAMPNPQTLSNHNSGIVYPITLF